MHLISLFTVDINLKYNIRSMRWFNIEYERVIYEGKFKMNLNLKFKYYSLF